MAKPQPKPDEGGQLSYTASGDINKMINSIYTQAPPDFKGEAAKDAKSVYAPVLDDLVRQGKTATGEARQDKAELNKSYSGLAASIAEDAKGIKANTAQQIASQTNNANNTQSAVAGNYERVNSNLAGLLQSLGLNTAAPDVLKGAAEQQGLLTSLVATQGQNANNLAQQLGANALNYNTAVGQIAKFEGAQKVAERQKLLTSTLNGIRTQFSNVKSQRAQNAQQLAAQLKSEYTNSLNNRANSLVQAYAQQQQMQIAQMQANAQIESAKLSASAQTESARIAAEAAAAQSKAALKAKGNAQTWSQTPAGLKIYGTAGQLFGPKLADRAVSEVNAVIADYQRTNPRNPQFPSAAAFVQALMTRIGSKGREQHGAAYKALAMSMWDILGMNSYQNNAFLNQNFMPGNGVK